MRAAIPMLPNTSSWRGTKLSVRTTLRYNTDICYLNKMNKIKA